MPHPKRSLEQEERALANSYVEHARRLQRSQHPHFRHDLAPDVVETPLPAPGNMLWAFKMVAAGAALSRGPQLDTALPNTFRTRRRVTPR